MASKHRNMFQKNKTQEPKENGRNFVLFWSGGNTADCWIDWDPIIGIRPSCLGPEFEDGVSSMDVQGVECDVRLDVCDEEGGGYNIVGAAYCCDYCGLVTGSRAELVLHMRLEHAADFGGTPTAEEAEGGDAKECVEGMPVGGEEVGDLVGQLVGCLSETSGKRRGRGRPRKDSAPMFKCHLCHFETSHKRPLLRHVADHLKSFSCGTCGHSAQTFDELEQHTCSPGAYPRRLFHKCGIPIDYKTMKNGRIKETSVLLRWSGIFL
ncbi:hypothetical protein AAG570_007341 [Ranatra chinensis]|uniref:C2H2-type domain-containing protein n=1 Tax=Ranatra chinensis TaxID=642074 RepID=A0ABD0YJC2_9HEMI